MVDPAVLVGGSGSLGAPLLRALRTAGRPAVVLDRVAPGEPAAEHRRADLTVDEVQLPPGQVVLLVGASAPLVRRGPAPELDAVVTTARLLPQLAGRRVVLVTRPVPRPPLVGARPAPERPFGLGTVERRAPGRRPDLRAWCERLLGLAAGPCPPHAVAALGRELAAIDPLGGGGEALVRRAQELLLRSVVDDEDLSVVRLPEVFGSGRHGAFDRLVHRRLAGLPVEVPAGARAFVEVHDLARVLAGGLPAGRWSAGLATVGLRAVAGLVEEELRALGRPCDDRATVAPDDTTVPPECRTFGRLLGADEPPQARLQRQLREHVRTLATPSSAPLPRALAVVVPPRPNRPDVVVARCAAALESGVLRHGGPWSTALERALHVELDLPPELVVLATASGSAALRLAAVALVGPALHGAVVVLPSYTFAATAEVLRQLGFRLRFCDVDPATWTLDPARLEEALAPGDVRLVVAVDALGTPADFAGLTAVTRSFGVPLLADSAPSLGARSSGVPVGQQADAHVFSMSFAKVVSAGGAGGALVLPADLVGSLRAPVDWTRSAMLPELGAVVALDLLADLEALRGRRAAVAHVYEEHLGSLPEVVPQAVRPGDRSAFVHWAARFPDRERLATALAQRGVGSRPYYAPALHLLDWQGGAEPADLPVTESLVRQVLALPTSSELSVEDAEQVAAVVRQEVLKTAAPTPSRQVG